MWVIRPSSFRCNLIGRGFMSQVSWIRRRDSHILTIDWLLFIADDRFRIFLVEPTCTWTLQIKYVQPRDAGIYECQINTSPKMSHLVQLNVVGKCIYFYFFSNYFQRCEVYMRKSNTVEVILKIQYHTIIQCAIIRFHLNVTNEMNKTVKSYLLKV